MIITPGFTWEHIVAFFEHWCENYQQQVESIDHDELRALLIQEVQFGQASLALVLELQAHPQINKYVPTRGMWLLTWHLDENHDLSLQRRKDRDEYLLDLDSNEKDLERTAFTRDEIVEAIYAYIQRYE